MAFRWLREDSSNMAVIDVKLVSGYQVDEESLDRVSYLLTAWNQCITVIKDEVKAFHAHSNH